MKRLLLVFVFMANAMASVAHAADESDRFNFRFNPLILLVGAVSVNLDFKVSEDWTIGPTATYWHFKLNSTSSYYTDKWDITAYSYGARANWFYHGAYNDGLYVGPSIEYRNVKIEATSLLGGGTDTGTASGMFGSCLVGYGWFWATGFNMMLGGGLNVGLGETDIEVTRSDGTKEKVSTRLLGGLALEWTAGWTF